ncbi:esterase [Corticibacter populi]|uniref:Esterase n=1 Tax=Corticibacter populi TaxID=1550736 RepID=A0A3M6QHN5_9BURK|nr:YqiA/YcfP family alpha/beta fold hydrolase [Corticibacter populi]RMX02606.1 esterase [Corticibacter populi]RZS32980.1 hypothetical protein EV687_1294 [Corticibacter populi]
MPPTSIQPPRLTHLLYLHGFRSSPQSAKAQLTRRWFGIRHPEVVLECPQLPPSPHAAAQCMQAIVNNWPQQTMAVMGSSLGGYYASWVAAQCRCPSVLLNPAVDPARDLAAHIGENTVWHDPAEAFYFKPEYMDELRALDSRETPAAAPQLAIIAKGDEVLDWREMSQRYRDAQQIVLEGGDHALSADYERLLPQIGAFLVSLGTVAA